MTEPLSLTGICKSYNKRPVLTDVTFSLMPGEIFGLIGLNGAGKTTLIKILLDLISADKGAARIFGQPAASLAARAALSYLPEKFQPSRYLTGYEYLDLTLSYYGRKLDKSRAQEVARRLDLAESALPQRVGAYSKGMGQKLGLLGAFMSGSPLLVLDEPMSGLDPKARIRLKDLLLSEKKEGRTVFFSSHILSDIDEICDRIGVIHEGRLFFVGTPAEFKKQHGAEGLERAFLHSIAA